MYILRFSSTLVLLGQDQFPLLVGVFLTAVTLVVFGSYVLARHKAWRGRALPARGKIVRLETDRAGEVIEPAPEGAQKSAPRRVWPVFRYEDHAGATHERRSTSSFARGSVRVGEEIELFYLRERPFAARHDDGSDVKVAVGALIGAAFFLLGLTLSFFLWL